MSRDSVGLALAGGGPEGAIYEIGALRALDECLDGVDFNRLDFYIGVSAGAFIASSLANDLTTAQMTRAIVKSEPGEHPFKPETFLRPAFGEISGRFRRIPRLLWKGVKEYLGNPLQNRPTEPITHLGGALPVGIFDNEPIRRYLETIYTMKGRSDDFRTLGKRLVIVAADIESGRPVRFCQDEMSHVPISRAVQASTALPGLFPPVEIDGRYYVDGVLLKTVHASLALDHGIKLLLCVNPLVPVDVGGGRVNGALRTGALLERGLPSVLSQTFRTLIYSRMVVGFGTYERRYPDADVVRIEPSRDDYRMFFTNIFSYADRRAVCEHAYVATRRNLWRRREELGPIFARHGVRLRVDLLERERDVWTGVGLSNGRPATEVSDRLTRALDRLERFVEARETG